MLDSIFVDPSSTSAESIRVGGVCYRKIGPSDETPGSYVIEAEFSACSDCQACESACVFLGSGGTYKATCDGTLTPICNDPNTADNSGTWTLIFGGVTYSVPGGNTGSPSISIVLGTTYSYSASGLVNINDACQVDPDGTMSGTGCPDCTDCPSCEEEFPGYACPCRDLPIFALIGQVSAS